MAKSYELAEWYTSRIINAVNTKDEIRKVLSEINKLYYTSNRNPVSNDDKASIVDKILSNLKDRSGFEKGYSGFDGTGDPEETFFHFEQLIYEHKEIVECFSNDNYPDLIDYIKSQTKIK